MFKVGKGDEEIMMLPLSKFALTIEDIQILDEVEKVVKTCD
ncbi:MAG: hypothetical protein PWQ22_178 [Archaeoglobaceae archaeon]|nr:hypothetical protein [Archaeoglobaceae archaeon]